MLIAQILFLIERNEEDQLEKVIESLRIYSSRHLSGKKAPRTTLFIKMLRQLANFQYNPQKVKQRTQSLHQQLKSHEMNSQEEVDAMEIIPYEMAWDIIIGRLGTKPVIQ